MHVYGLPQGEDAVERQRAVLEAVVDVVRRVVLVVAAPRAGLGGGGGGRRRGVEALGLVPGAAQDRDHGDGAAAKVPAQRQDVARVAADDEGAEVGEPEDLVEGDAGEVGRRPRVAEHARQGPRHGQRGAVHQAVRVLQTRRPPQLPRPRGGQPPARHVGLPRVREEAQPAAAAVVLPPPPLLALAPRAPQPLADLVVALEAARGAAAAAAPNPAGQLAHADEARVGVLVETVPEAAVAGPLGQVPEGIPDELDGSGGVGDEDEVEVAGVGAEEGEGLGPDGVDGAARERRGRVGAVRVAVEVGRQAAGEAVYEGPRVDGGAAVVEVDACFWGERGKGFVSSCCCVLRGDGGLDETTTDLCSCVGIRSPGSSEVELGNIQHLGRSVVVLH